MVLARHSEASPIILDRPRIQRRQQGASYYCAEIACYLTAAESLCLTGALKESVPFRRLGPLDACLLALAERSRASRRWSDE